MRIDISFPTTGVDTLYSRFIRELEEQGRMLLEIDAALLLTVAMPLGSKYDSERP